METFIDNNKQLTHKDIEEAAKIMLNKTVIVSNQKTYRICEIEFYLRNKNHKDEYTHCNPDQKKYGKWYFHKFKNGTYKAGTFKGMDLTLGSKDNYCGILIRAIYDIEDDKMIEGPCKTVNELIGNHGCKNVKEFMADKDDPLERNNSFIYILDKPDLEEKELYKGPRIGLSDKYPEWRDANYRYVVMKNKIKKKKRSLVAVEKSLN